MSPSAPAPNPMDPFAHLDPAYFRVSAPDEVPRRRRARTCPPAPRRRWRRPAGRTAYHHGDLRRAALVLAGRLVARHGAEALSIRGLARQLGVSVAAIRYHFGRKDVFLAEVADVADHLLRERVTHSGIELEPLVREWTAWGRSHPNLYRLLAIQAPVRLGSSSLRPSSHRLLLRRLDEVIARGARRTRSPSPSPAVAWSVYAGLHGFASLPWAEPREGAALALVRGLAAPPPLRSPRAPGG